MINNVHLKQTFYFVFWKKYNAEWYLFSSSLWNSITCKSIFETALGLTQHLMSVHMSLAHCTCHKI